MPWLGKSNGFDALTDGPWCAINSAVDSRGQVAELSTNAIEFTAARLLSGEDLDIFGLKDKANITAPRSRFVAVAVDIDLKDNIDSISVGFKATTRQWTQLDALYCDRLRLVEFINSYSIAELSTNDIGFTAARLLSGEDLDIDLAIGLTITWIVATARLLQSPPRTLALLPQLEEHTECVEGYSFLGEYHAKP